MKKLLISLLGSLGGIALFGGFFALVSANSNNDCRDVTFINGTVCVALNQLSNNNFELQTDNSIGTLRCDILLPDNTLRSIPLCNGTFNYSRGDTGKFKLYIRSNEIAPEDRDGKPSDNSQRTYPSWMYDFDNGEWASDVNNNNNNNGDLDNFLVTTDDTSPSINQYVDLNIKARDSSNSTITDFTDTVKFKVYYGDASNSTWTQTTSSSYYQISSSFTNGYDFDSSDNGYAQLSNIIEFKNSNYDYKVRVYDENDTSIYKDIIFYVNNPLNGAGNITVTASPSDPNENEWTNITVDVYNDYYTYNGTVEFVVQKKSGSTWSTAPSSYYQLNRTSYTFNNSTEETLSNLVKFTQNGTYRLEVYDISDSSLVGYSNEFDVGNNNNNNGDLDHFTLTTDDTSPTTYQYVDLNIKALDSSNSTLTDFSDTVNFKVYYGHASSSSWTQTTSSSYYSMSSNYNNNGYDFSNSNNGYANLSNFIEFKNSSYDYKVRVQDSNDSSIYKEIIFYVNGNGNDNNNSNTNGFSSSELNTVQSMYDAWPGMISDLKSTYSVLRNSTSWKNRSDTLYSDMSDIINDVSNRTYDNYSQFYNAFVNRYNYTISIR